MAKKVSKAVGINMDAGKKERKESSALNKQQQAAIAEQDNREKMRIAEEEDEINRVTATNKTKNLGRRSLIRTSEVGLQNRKTLG